MPGSPLQTTITYVYPGSYGYNVLRCDATGIPAHYSRLTSQRFDRYGTNPVYTVSFYCSGPNLMFSVYMIYHHVDGAVWVGAPRSDYRPRQPKTPKSVYVPPVGSQYTGSSLRRVVITTVIRDVNPKVSDASNICNMHWSAIHDRNSRKHH